MTMPTNKKSAPRGSAVDRRFGKPPGEVLAGLKKLRNLGGEMSELFYPLRPGQDETQVDLCRAKYGIELLGRSHDQLCYFGAPKEWKAATVDGHPVVLVDNDCVDPQVVAASLADFLSLIAFSPVAWGASPEEWKKCRSVALEEHGKEVADIQKKLSKLPGVRLPERPWELQEDLPSVEFRSAPGGKLTQKRLQAEAGQVFAALANTSRTVLLLSLENTTLDPSAKRGLFEINVNCPTEWAAQVGQHDVVRKPLATFLSEMRGRHPGVALELELIFDPIDTGRGVEAAVGFALRHAGAMDLIERLGLPRS